MNRRRAILGAAGVAAVLLGAHVAYWNWAAHSLRQGIDTWAGAWRQDGWQVETGPIAVAGWPDRVAARLSSLRLTHSGNGAAGGMGIVADGAVVSLSLWWPSSLSIDLTGEERVTLPGRDPFAVRSDVLTITAPLARTATMPMTLRGHAVRVEGGDGRWVTAVTDLEGQATPSSTDRGEAAVLFALDARGIDLPNAVRWPLGGLIRDLAAQGVLNGPFPPARRLADQAGAWRDGGGSLDVRKATVDWGPLHLTGSATLALDEDLQPMGSGIARASGYVEALDRMAAAGVLTRSAATVAKAMLSLLAGDGAEDAQTEVEVPLSLQYRTLSMRQVPLVRLPELDWSAE